jgi:hypothetical protein
MFAAPNTFFTGTAPALQTYTFPGGTSTWTAPTGVTSILIATGKGAAGNPSSSGSATNNNFTYVAVSNYYSTPTPPYADWSSIYSAATSALAALNAGGPGVRAAPTGIDYYTLSIVSTNYYGVNTGGASLWLGDSQTITGTFSLSPFNSPLTSGNVTYSYVSGGGSGTRSVGWTISVPYDYVINATTGASTTGFGKDFPGGYGGAASNTTFNNVAITPGVTYTIVNNGSLTIQYYAP